MPNDHFLFAYGTLKKGFINHGYLRTGTYIGTFEIEGAKLLDLGHAPALLLAGLPFNDEARSSKVRGELWQVDIPTIKAIDALEGHPKLYERQQVCWYEYAKGCMRPVHSYVWKSSYRDDNSTYVSEWLGKKKSESTHTSH